MLAAIDGEQDVRRGDSTGLIRLRREAGAAAHDRQSDCTWQGRSSPSPSQDTRLAKHGAALKRTREIKEAAQIMRIPGISFVSLARSTPPAAPPPLRLCHCLRGTLRFPAAVGCDGDHAAGCVIVSAHGRAASTRHCRRRQTPRPPPLPKFRQARLPPGPPHRVRLRPRSQRRHATGGCRRRPPARSPAGSTAPPSRGTTFPPVQPFEPPSSRSSTRDAAALRQSASLQVKVISQRSMRLAAAAARRRPAHHQRQLKQGRAHHDERFSSGP